MSIILPLLWFLLITISLSFLLNRKVSFSIPLAFILTALLIMIGGYIGDLRIGLIVVLLVPAISAYKIVTKRLYTKENILVFLKENAVVLVLFSLLFIYLCLYHSSSHFNGWDEYTHWGPMVKGMYESNQLYCYLDINLTHPEYPPLFQCIEWLFCYLSRSYTEASLYRGVSVFTVSLVFPVLYSLHNKKLIEQIKYSLVFLLIILLLFTIDFTMLYSIFSMALLDAQIAIIPGVLAYLIIINKEEDRILTTSFLTAILLTKEIGIAFYLCIIVLVVVIRIIINKEKDYITKLLIYVVIPMMFLISWKIYTKDIAAGQFSVGRLSLQSLIDIVFANKGMEHQLFVRNNFVQALLTTRILRVELFNTPFILLTIFLMIIFVFLIFAIYKNITKTLIVSIGMILGIFGYCFTLFVLYLFCFSSGEALQLASFPRYFGSFVLYMSIIIVYILYDRFVNNDDNRKQISILLTTLILLYISDVKQIHTNNHTNDVTETYQFKNFAKQIENNCVGKNKILIIDYEYHHHIADYYFYKDNNFKSEIIKDSYTKDEFINLYKNKYDYIYIWNYNEPIKNAVEELSNCEIESETLYKVDSKNLIKIEQ